MAGKKTAPAPAKTSGGGNAPEKAPSGIAPATEFDMAGAPVQTVPDLDPEHPAVDNDPRAHTTVEQNRIDFNDPNLSGAEAVERALKGKE